MKINDAIYLLRGYVINPNKELTSLNREKFNQALQIMLDNSKQLLEYNKKLKIRDKENSEIIDMYSIMVNLMTKDLESIGKTYEDYVDKTDEIFKKEGKNYK